MTTDTYPAPCLAIVVPCYNEQEVLPATLARLRALLQRMKEEGLVTSGSKIAFVDDGSRDSTWTMIAGAVEEWPGEVAGVRLAHNAGHQNALLAGLEAVERSCDATVSIDADLQDDPEAIVEMVRQYRAGCDIVYGVRRSRRSDTWFKRNTALLFYHGMERLGVETVFNHADFRLMSRRAVAELLKYRESGIFLRGVVPHIGFRQGRVEYDRTAREAGESKYPLRKMMNFAVDGITSFSVKPVRMVFWLGMLFMLMAIVVLIYTLARYFSNDTIVGWTSLMISIWFCTGIVLIALGIIGEYIGKIFIEVKKRPRYAVDTVLGL